VDRLTLRPVHSRNQLNTAFPAAIARPVLREGAINAHEAGGLIDLRRERITRRLAERECPPVNA
jgi:hypothetical protein